jgi:ubiquinone/menaquinone biosynthesis C-methylase UbiE
MPTIVDGSLMRMARTNRIAVNRTGWDARSDLYQHEAHRAGMYATGEIEWGPNAFAESEVKALGSVRNKDVLEIGCGAAQFGIALARKGARMTGIDLSRAQLRHARKNVEAAGVTYRLEHGNAEDLSRFRPRSFDLVVSDFAAGFLDLDVLLPQIRRVLRPGGRVALSWASPILDCLTDGGERPLLTFVHSYFDRKPWRSGGADPTWEFKRTYGDWIRAFASARLTLIDCIEPQAREGQTHTWWPQYKWQRTSRVPGTCIWVARKL